MQEGLNSLRVERFSVIRYVEGAVATDNMNSGTTLPDHVCSILNKFLNLLAAVSALDDCVFLPRILTDIVWSSSI
ncbi:hypothetical protein CXR29_01130 [Brevibacterium linens]|nr:hypothetical protein CXR29_01130 [Brevibacterium linens]